MREIVGLVPVCNPNGEDLHLYKEKMTEELRSLKLTVLAEITDDNRLNQRFYSILAPDGSYQVKYDNSEGATDITHLFFDSIHIAKNVRNNWLNKKDFEKTFWYPDFDDFKTICKASFLDLRDIYKADFSANKLLRKAYKLNKKTLYPSNFERQRVLLE